MAESSRWQLDYMKRRVIELEGLPEAAGMRVTRPNKQQFEEACRSAYGVLFDKLGPQASQIAQRVRETK